MFVFYHCFPLICSETFLPSSSLYLQFSPFKFSTFIINWTKGCSFTVLSLSFSLGLVFVYESMIPTYRYSVSSPMPLDLNEEDHTHHNFFPSNHNQLSPSSNSSLSYSTIFNPLDHDQPGSCNWDVSKHSQSDQQGERVVPSSVSWDYSALEKDDVKVKVWKKEDGNCESFQGEEDNSVKWMPSKKRMIRRMMVWDQTSNSDVAGITKKENNYEEQKLPLSPLGNGNSTSNNSSSQSNITVRVCSDCHTTKTPLWRSGPRGPKSLCNACGIRQRKARRAMAAAASANGTVPEATENKSHLKANNKFRCKGKKLRTDQESEPKLKKKRKLNNGAKSSLGNRKKFSFEDLKLSLSKNLALQKVFPQDEKEAAILLMALSYGLLHGFPSHRYLE